MNREPGGANGRAHALQPFDAMTRALVCLLAWSAAGCSSSLGGTEPPGGHDAGDERQDAQTPDAGVDRDSGGGDPDAAVPPFHCDVADPGSPRLQAVVRTDPASPHPGDTLVVVVHSYAVDARDAPHMTLHADTANGTRDVETTMIAGGRAVYYFAVSDLPLGDVCVQGLVDGAPEVAAKVEVTPRPSVPRGAGVYKVVANHQWSCDEEVEFGIVLRAIVRDAAGQPVPGAVVRLDWPATTERPIHNDNPPPEPTLIPATMTTGDDGVADLWTDLGDGNRFPTNEHGYMVFNLSVDGAPSDVATEITTGWWETDTQGCKYCDGARNVWGHWSHTVEFQLDPAATQACVVPSDHAGMARCQTIHVHHDPAHMACWPVE